MKRGHQTKKQRNTHASRLLDQLGPEGRVGENVWTKQKGRLNLCDARWWRKVRRKQRKYMFFSEETNIQSWYFFFVFSVLCFVEKAFKVHALCWVALYKNCVIQLEQCFIPRSQCKPPCVLPPNRRTVLPGRRATTSRRAVLLLTPPSPLFPGSSWFLSSLFFFQCKFV